MIPTLFAEFSCLYCIFTLVAAMDANFMIGLLIQLLFLKFQRETLQIIIGSGCYGEQLAWVGYYNVCPCVSQCTHYYYLWL